MTDSERQEAIKIIKSECYISDLLDLDRTRMVNTALDTAIEALEILDDYAEDIESGNWGTAYSKARTSMCALSSVDPERKKGHWIIHSDDLFPSESTQECSECHEHQPLDWRHSDNYCPNCGADMREVQDE